MSNIVDYLIQNRDILYKNDFNNVDGLILARLSYLNYIDDSFEIKNLINHINGYKYILDSDLVKQISISNRFNNMFITDHVLLDDKVIEKQFHAITIHISDKVMYLSFMGTDNSINGWKEDSNMSFMDNVPCQIEAKHYLSHMAKKYPNKKIYLGGHSKGGNMAIYSAITASNNIKKRIIKVYNFDGPGFSKKIIDEYYDKKIISKITSYIPESSIIGRMLNHVEEIKIIKSNKKSIMAHNIYSWNILFKDFVYAKNNTFASEDIDYTLTEWLDNTDPKQREIFVNTIFEIINSTDMDTFSDIIKNLPRSVPKILKKYSSIPKKDKQIISEMITIMIKKYAGIFGIRSKIKLDRIRKNIQENSNKLINRNK